MKKNKWALLLFLMYLTGFILYFISSLRSIGTGFLIAAVTAHIIYTFSPQQRAAIDMLNARRALEVGNIEKAHRYIEQFLKISKDKKLVGYLLSTSKKTKENYTKLATILGEDPKNQNNPFLKYIIASIYYNTRDIEKSTKILETIPEEQRDSETIRLLGTNLLENKKFDEAIRIFQTKEKKEGIPTPEELSILMGLGLCYAEKNDIKKAEWYYERVKKFNPAFPALSNLKEKIYPDEKN